MLLGLLPRGDGHRFDGQEQRHLCATPFTAIPNGGSCSANTDCCSGICQQGTCYATVAGTCALTANFCTTLTTCGTYPGCICSQTVAGDAFCGQSGRACAASCDECAIIAGATCVQGGGEHCTDCPYFCAVLCQPS